MTEVIRAGKEFAIPEDNIKYYASAELNWVKRIIRERKQEGSLINACCGHKALTAIFLKTGELVLSNVSFRTFDQRLSGVGGNPD